MVVFRSGTGRSLPGTTSTKVNKFHIFYLNYDTIASKLLKKQFSIR